MNDFRWDQRAQEIFDQLIKKTPVFLQQLARDKVQAEIARCLGDGKRLCVTEKDVVDAFFKVTPFGFHGPMKIDMQAIGVDLKSYGY